jgi:hypothetical protein
MSGLACSSITLAQGEIPVSIANLTVAGPTDHVLTVSGANVGRVFYHSGTGVLALQNFAVAYCHTSGVGGCIDSYGALSLYNMQIHHGSAASAGCTSSIHYTFLNHGSSVYACAAANAAGGVRSAGDVLINASSVTGNTAYQAGGIGAVGNIVSLNGDISGNTATKRWGAMYAAGHMALSFSSVNGNTANYCAGIVILGSYATLTSTTVESNTALTGRGGGICAYTDSDGSPRTLTLYATTVSGNHAYTVGGGIAVSGYNKTSRLSTQVTLSNSTISGNSAGARGGGIDIVPGDVRIRNSTVAFNLAPLGGGIYLKPLKHYGQYAECALALYSSIIAKNSGTTIAPDFFDQNAAYCGGPPFSSKDNLVGHANVTDAGWLTGVDPLLAPLAGHGGRVKTHALLPGSPAIDAGDNNFALADDARGAGFPRVAGAKADLGAYERQSLDDEIFYSGME